jgi:uncharacterized protein YpmS
MAETFNLEDVPVSEVIEGITAFILAPAIFPIAAAIKQPMVQSVIKEGITLSERCKEAIAEVTETIDNLAAEVNSDLIARKQEQSNFPSYITGEQVDVAGTLMNTLSNANAEMRRMTNGWLDWRLLIPMGLGTLAIRQILIKGLRIDDIPWYVLTWYAFDSFGKLNANSDASD